MEISFKHQSTNKMNNAACSVTEYSLNNEMLDFAIATISGRYPDNRCGVNQKCDELVYVFKGEGKIVVNYNVHQLSAGDVVLIEAGEKYYRKGI